MKKLFLGLIIAGLVTSCGGGTAPGTDEFSTVYLTTSIEKSVINVDLVDLKLSNNICLRSYTMSPDEQQNVTFFVLKKPNLPLSVNPSDIVIYNFDLKLYPAVKNTEPFQRCFSGVYIPTGVYTVQPNGNVKIPISVINQGMKECLVENYGQVPASCDKVNFEFGPLYSVYAVLSFTAKEVYTGKEKRFEINLGTFNLSDYATATNGSTNNSTNTSGGATQ